MSDLISRSEEIWKPIPEYEGIYEVSNLGNVRSVDRYLDCKIKNVNKHLWKGRIISQQKRKDGILTVALYSHSKRKRMLVHRVVADAFIPNPNNYPCINHKDENKENNRFDNLEWCDAACNNCYGTRLERVVKSKINGKNSYPVIQKIDNKVIETFPSLREVQRRTGYNKSLISKCCKGIYKQAYGYNWEFVSK